MQSDARHWTKHHFPALIEHYLNAITDQDELIHIDSLVIELDDYPWKITSTDWEAKMDSLFLGITQDEAIVFTVYDQWQYFLSHGAFERNALIKSIAETEAILMRYGNRLRSASSTLHFGITSETILFRLFSSHTDEFVQFILGLWLVISNEETINLHLKIKSILRSEPSKAIAILHNILNKGISPDLLFDKQNTVLAEAPGLPSIKDLPKETRYPKNADVFDECPNGGLILLVPYIQRFFQQLGLVESGQFITNTALIQGIQLLHYVSTGTSTGDEDELVLPKILCGIPVNTFIHFEEDLPALFLHECDELVSSVIEHWTVLQNTSIDGLRETFLQRPGKIRFNEDHFLLIVEESGVDILLQHLPWGFRNFRLPWMSHPIITEWY